jgi:hypothetical protein
MTVTHRLKDSVDQAFHILNGMPSYLGLEQKMSINKEIFSSIIDELLLIGTSEQLNRVSVHLRKELKGFNELEFVLTEKGFEHFTSSVEYRKDLSSVNDMETNFSYFTLQDGVFTEIEFKTLWENAMSGSGNQRSTFTMDEHMSSLKNELGPNWERNCSVFYKDDRPVAVCIPHIEPGTVDEGRLFYFGVLPEVRGKGYASVLHQFSLFLLKEMGASIYIGSTHETNKVMQRIFEKSDCQESGRRSSYYYYFSNGKG